MGIHQRLFRLWYYVARQHVKTSRSFKRNLLSYVERFNVCESIGKSVIRGKIARVYGYGGDDLDSR